MTLDVKLEGVKELAKRLDEPKVYDEAVIAMTQATGLLWRNLGQYPPPPPDSTYNRTGLLGRSWTAETRQLTHDIQGVVSNAAPYSPYVQGMQQTGRHAETGWLKIDNAYKQAKEQIMGFFKAALARASKYFAG